MPINFYVCLHKLVIDYEQFVNTDTTFLFVSKKKGYKFSSHEMITTNKAKSIIELSTTKFNPMPLV